MATTHIHVRDARDRVLDILGIGQTYPLRDLMVSDAQLTVAFNTTAKIPLEPSQRDVMYQLLDKDTKPVHSATVQGNGERAILETPQIHEDITYTIRAKKIGTGKESTLIETATVKVGLDVTLQAQINNADLLEPRVDNPSPTAPRIIAHGKTVTVEIRNSQEGVDYCLVAVKDAGSGRASSEETKLSDPVRGKLDSNIKLRSTEIFEDTELRIRATKTFDPSENRPTQTALLDTMLPLKVRANTALQVSADSSIIDFRNQALIKIAATEKNASYRLFLRTIRDRDIIYTSQSAVEVAKVAVPGQPDVQVRKSFWRDTWTTPDGYQAVSELQNGTGRELRIPIADLTEDSMVIVQAQKTHHVASTAVLSDVQLEQVVIILVRPNPIPSLKVNAIANTDIVQVTGGQAGVLYFFRTEPQGKDVGPPVYFHQRDDDDQTSNKGIGQLVVEVNFIVARDFPAEKLQGLLDRAQTPPEPPLLEAPGLQSGATLHVRAVKARTRVSADLKQPVTVEPEPSS